LVSGIDVNHSEGDLVAADLNPLQRYQKIMKIKDVKKNLVSIDGESKIIDACKLMGKIHIGSVLFILSGCCLCL